MPGSTSPLTSGTSDPVPLICQAEDSISSSIGAVGGRLASAPITITAQAAKGATCAVERRKPGKAGSSAPHLRLAASAVWMLIAADSPLAVAGSRSSTVQAGWTMRRALTLELARLQSRALQSPLLARGFLARTSGPTRRQIDPDHADERKAPARLAQGANRGSAEL